MKFKNKKISLMVVFCILIMQLNNNYNMEDKSKFEIFKNKIKSCGKTTKKYYNNYKKYINVGVGVLGVTALSYITWNKLSEDSKKKTKNAVKNTILTKKFYSDSFSYVKSFFIQSLPKAVKEAAIYATTELSKKENQVSLFKYTTPAIITSGVFYKIMNNKMNNAINQQNAISQNQSNRIKKMEKTGNDLSNNIKKVINLNEKEKAVKRILRLKLKKENDEAPKIVKILIKNCSGSQEFISCSEINSWDNLDNNVLKKEELDSLEVAARLKRELAHTNNMHEVVRSPNRENDFRKIGVLDKN